MMNNYDKAIRNDEVRKFFFGKEEYTCWDKERNCHNNKAVFMQMLRYGEAFRWEQLLNQMESDMISILEYRNISEDEYNELLCFIFYYYNYFSNKMRFNYDKILSDKLIGLLRAEFNRLSTFSEMKVTCDLLKSLKTRYNCYILTDSPYNHGEKCLREIPEDYCGEYVVAETINIIGNYAFQGCSKISSIVLSKSILCIEWHAFDGCSSLEYISIPQNVSFIGEYAFRGCKCLKSILIPNKVFNLGNFLFEDCNSLQEINVEEDSLHYCSIKGVLYDNAMTTLIKCPNAYVANEFKIPDSVNCISPWSFHDNYTIKKVIIPENIQKISPSSFHNCPNLKVIDINKKDLTSVSIYYELEKLLGRGCTLCIFNDAIITDDFRESLKKGNVVWK